MSLTLAHVPDLGDKLRHLDAGLVEASSFLERATFLQFSRNNQVTMPFETLYQRPVEADFTPLQEHQTRTPESFFLGNPVLHCFASGLTAVFSSSKISSLSIFTDTIPAASVETHTNGTHTNGDSNGFMDSLSNMDKTIDFIDVWVASHRLLFFRCSNNTGLSIPYPNITVHAIQRSIPPWSTTGEERQGLYMQLTLGTSEEDEEGDEEDLVELTLHFRDSTPPITNGQNSPQSPQASSLIGEMYEAISACAILHPDPVRESEEGEGIIGGVDDRITLEDSVGYQSGLIIAGNNTGDGELPPPFPGSGGWITAENMGDYFDEQGNWKEGLGPGAGTVRQRANDPELEEAQRDDNGERNGEDSKWMRTS
ncbi:MAG: hypothetical protein M1814_005721 [Vezdaea aestivalis]|nr:MAG: hypothetical protein M1814_005721 [Vezdaea aestivalis]